MSHECAVRAKGSCSLMTVSIASLRIVSSSFGTISTLATEVNGSTGARLSDVRLSSERGFWAVTSAFALALACLALAFRMTFVVLSLNIRSPWFRYPGQITLTLAHWVQPDGLASHWDCQYSACRQTSVATYSSLLLSTPMTAFGMLSAEYHGDRLPPQLSSCRFTAYIAEMSLKGIGISSVSLQILRLCYISRIMSWSTW